MNTAPIHLVAFASLASKLLALPFAIKVSATPPMVPERPALLPESLMEVRRGAQAHFHRYL